MSADVRKILIIAIAENNKMIEVIIESIPTEGTSGEYPETIFA